MATTTNYGWTTPDDTALVKDGAAAIRSLGSSIDSTLKTQIDAQIPDSIIDAKGDLIVGTADNTPAKLSSSAVNGQVLTVDTSTASGLKWASPSGLTWTQRQAGTGNRIYTIAYNGSNLWVAAGAAGALYTSPDGTTWTSRTSGFGANIIYDVSFGNGLWVAVGQNGTLTTSSDGITWTARTSNFASIDINKVVYANSLWVAVGAGGGSTNTGGIIYSTDGLTWTRKSQTPTVGTTYYDVVWNGTNWIVGATSSTNNYLYASTPSGTWTAGATGSTGTIFAIFWDGTRHITIEGSGSEDRYSTSATLGTTTAYTVKPVGGGRFYSKYYNGKVYNSYWYLQSYTPTSSLYPTLDAPPIIVPVASTKATTPGFDIPNYTFWVGANGYIFGDTDGRIYTSF